jgi:hypothetical protein
MKIHLTHNENIKMMEDIIRHLKLENYEYCRAGKTITKPFAKDTRAKFPFQVINYDICGPINVRARHDDVYFIIFIDDFTRYGYVFFIFHKSKALIKLLHKIHEPSGKSIGHENKNFKNQSRL